MYLWNLKYATDDSIYKTEIDYGQGEQTFGSQWGGWREWDGLQGFGCKLLYLK